jgi:uncharacterized protein (TIGR02444 family)
VIVMAGKDAAAERLWRFSLMVYSRPGVAEALIRLQDHGGHNVSLILFGLWLGLCENLRLDAAALARAKAAIARLDGELVAPLRRLRQALKGESDADLRDLRRRVLALEIAAERRVQARLADLAAAAAPSDQREAAAAANLRLILGADDRSNGAELLRRALGQD